MNNGLGGFGAGVRRSEPIAWAAGGVYRLVHGFGVMPSQVRVVLRFTAASGRFAAGDEMVFTSSITAVVGGSVYGLDLGRSPQFVHVEVAPAGFATVSGTTVAGVTVLIIEAEM